MIPTRYQYTLWEQVYQKIQDVMCRVVEKAFQCTCSVGFSIEILIL